MFNRVYWLRIGSVNDLLNADSKITVQSGSGSGVLKPAGGSDTLTAPPSSDISAMVFTQHQFTAEIESSKDSSIPATSCKIALYNLSQEEIDKIKEKSIVMLQAGYEDDEEYPILFGGQVVLVKTASNGIDKVTSLVCSGAYLIKKNVRISKSFPPGMTYKQIVDELLDELAIYGMPLGGFYEKPQVLSKDLPNLYTSRMNIKPTSGLQVHGYLFEQLVSICEDRGFRVYIFNGKIYIEPKEFSPSLQVFNIVPEIILGTISPSVEASTSPSGSDKSLTGVTIKTPVDGRITLDKKIRITLGDYAGYYDIKELKIVLDFEGDDWLTELKLVKVTGG